jgi:hypothetical protein
MSGYEETVLARAEVLEDTDDLAQSVSSVLAGAQGAGVDPAAVASLAAAACALDLGANTSYDAGSKHDRHSGSGYRSDGEFLEAVSDAEDDLRERLRDAEQLRELVATAMDAAQAALDAAYAMPVTDPCTGCHGAKEAAIQDALRRIGLCEAAAEVLDPLAQRLRQALDHLRQVPEDLGEVYELVYEFICKGGKLPAYGRWIEGSGTRLPPGNRNPGCQSGPCRIGPGAGASAQYRLHLLRWTGYPALPELPGPAGHADGAEFAAAVRRVAVAASRDDSLPVLSAVPVTFAADALTLVATDRYRAALRRLPWRSAGTDLPPC